MAGEATFRDYINSNKRKILEYLKDKGFRSTSEIHRKYGGEPYIDAVRKALRELKAEGLVIDKIQGLNTKYWKLCDG